MNPLLQRPLMSAGVLKNPLFFLFRCTMSEIVLQPSCSTCAFVTDLVPRYLKKTNSNNLQSDNEQKTSETKTEGFALKTEVFAFTSRSNGKTKPRGSSTTCSSSRTVPILERTWIDIQPGGQLDQAYPVSERLNTFCTENYSEKKMERSNSGDWKMIFGKGLSTHNIGMEEQDGRRRRQQEKISIPYWSVRTNSLLPSPSKSSRTQSHWSHTAGQCVNSGQFRVHLSFLMCTQFTFHHKFRIDSGRSKF